MTENSLRELSWWIDNIELKNGKRIRPRSVDFYCRTDASLEGWGGIDLESDMFVNGKWTNEEANKQINYLELLAIFRALKGLYVEREHIHIQIQSDNVSAVAYINDMGGMVSPSMDRLAVSIWNWCIKRDIYLTAVYIRGVENSADFYSRNFSDSTEWQLKKEIFDRLCKHFFQPDVDLFASSLNHQISNFVSWFPESGAMACNAFSMNWNSFSPYLFPPFNLIGRVVNKVISDKVEKSLLIFPNWPTQSWFPLLLECICSYPVRLPRHRDLLKLPTTQENHPLSRRLGLIGVIVSGQPWRVEAFRQVLRDSLLNHGVQERGVSTNMHGDNGVFGAVSGLKIPFKRLKLK